MDGLEGEGRGGKGSGGMDCGVVVVRVLFFGN